MKYYVSSATPMIEINAIFDHLDSRLIALENPVDYKAKYNELRATIAIQMETLKPWYVDGSVVSPMDAIVALKNIDKAVNS